MPPLFISLDGIDGTGKSTQCRLLAEWLCDQGYRVTSCVDPGGTPVGEELRKIVLGHRLDLSLRCETLLFMASRAELVQRIIRPALGAGHVVVSDRFLLANVVYQGHAGGMDVEELWKLGRFSTGGLEPDLTIVLDLPVEQAQARRQRKADRVEQRDNDYQIRVRQGFLTEASHWPERYCIVDANSSIDEVQMLIRQIVQPLLRGGSR